MAQIDQVTPISIAAPSKTSRLPATNVEAFTIVSYVGVGLFAIFCIIPLWMIVSGSFTEESTLALAGYSLVPWPFSLDAYQQIFSGQRILQAYVASLFITIVGTLLSTTCTAGLAWVIARKAGRTSRILAIYSYLPMLFSGGLVPMYLLIAHVLGLRDSWWAVILPHLIAPFLVFVAVSSFRQLPEELLDAARIDGANELQIFLQIVLPLSRPILAVVALFYGVAYWNEWFNAMLFLTSPDKFPLQYVLQQLIGNVTAAAELPGQVDASPPVYQLRLALTVVTIGPIVLAYPFAQRHFVRGLTLGATKG
ncbi:MAG: carbohydrate ABC transporter permease [Devosia nanyangense]|nr:carbohydrate ABC transporter permease [Devosia nanyangense]CDP52532.1 ABC transporter, permease protein [Devosia sp. DBB001]